jgi:hypothetical protein
VQWIGPELPYTMIELYVDPAGATPLYEAVLTERATGKRVHYANQQQMVDLDKRSGAEAYLTKMQLDRPANAGTGATYLLRFVDHAGEPVSWQFIQGSDISERGGGSSPAGVEPPVLMYRGRSAVAGEGTALKIGKPSALPTCGRRSASRPTLSPIMARCLRTSISLSLRAPGSNGRRSARPRLWLSARNGS